MIEPYYSDNMITLYHGKMEEVLLDSTIYADVAITDPPYGETTLKWDRWPAGWPLLMTLHTTSMWCFGSMRTFMRRSAELKESGWTLSQDIIGVDEDGQPVYGDVHVVWEKHNGSGFAADRFRRVHEHALLFYQGPWKDIHRDVPRVPAIYNPKRRKGAAINNSANLTPHTGQIGPRAATDDHTRLMRSVIYAKSMQRRAIHRTEKPVEILGPMIQYSCPVGGLVLDPFAGSASTLLTARSLGRRSIGIEADEAACEKAAKRLAELDLLGGAVS